MTKNESSPAKRRAKPGASKAQLKKVSRKLDRLKTTVRTLQKELKDIQNIHIIRQALDQELRRQIGSLGQQS